MTTCRHCDRHIVKNDGAWVDPEATGDDAAWRETCDSHDTFTAEHEPAGMRSEWGDLHHGKFSSPMCHYVAEAHDGSIVGDADVYECSDVDVDYWARLGKRRIYHEDSQGFHYLWRFTTEAEADSVFNLSTDHLRDDEDENEGHQHRWGPLEQSRLAGTVHRKCQVEGCRFVNLLDDEEKPDE